MTKIMIIKNMKLVVLVFGVLLPLFCIALPEKTISQDDLDNGAVALDGLWAFDWHELHTDINAPMRDGLSVPGLWHQQGSYTAQGFATIRLKVNMPALAVYYLRVPDVPSAMSLWVNGKLHYQRGVVSNLAELEEPKFGPDVVALPPSDEYEFILHISNHHHKDGGIWHNFLIANDANKPALRDQSKAVDVIIFTFIMLASIALLIINLSRHGHVSHILFAIFMWAIALRSIMVGERVAYDFVTGISWENWQRLEHLLLFIALPSFVYFFHRFFSIKKLYFAHVVLLVSLVLFIGTLLYPAVVFTNFGPVSQLLGMVNVVYMLIVLAILIKQKVQYSILFAVSFIGAAMFVIHDYLYTHLVIQSRPLSQFGMVFFVALQMYTLWLHRKNDLKLMMFVKSSIDHKASDLAREHLLQGRSQVFGMIPFITKMKPYCDILGVTVMHRNCDFELDADEEKLQTILLIIARMVNKNGMRATLSMNAENDVVTFRFSLDASFNAQMWAPDDMNAVHTMLNDFSQVLKIKRTPKVSMLEFSLPIYVREDEKRTDLNVTGNKLASSILFNGDDSGVVEESLKDHFYLFDTKITRENIIKHRPSLIIWQVHQWDAYLYEDMKAIISEFSSIPVLLVVEHYHKAQLAQCIRLGIIDYIVTPVLPEELLLKVQRVHVSLKSLPLPVSTQDIRDVAVQLVRDSIALWQKYSNKSKVDLAESSRLWRVYVDGSTAKTRTLDKYLSLQTLPKNPRWETVSRTANFVLEQCDLNEKDKRSLVQQLTLFNQLLAA